MSIVYFNGKFLPFEEVKISPDDRGFLFADGVYEVVRWYAGFFYDMDGHVARLKRSLKETRIEWHDAEQFRSFANELIEINNLSRTQAIVYLQVTRGAAKRIHTFPIPPVLPTSYAFARAIKPDSEMIGKGLNIILKKDIRWHWCDIKSVSLLPNVMSIQEAVENDAHECVFVRDGVFTECSHSNFFVVMGNTLYTHPESQNILSGITRKNVLRIAKENGFNISETAVNEAHLPELDEAFFTNTSFEIAPVISINGKAVGNGKPGLITTQLRKLFEKDLKKQSDSFSETGK